MRLYTGSGDKGETGLIGGSRVTKDDARIRAFGDVDELNASLGWVAVVCEEPSWRERIETIQDRLFVIGARLADPRPDADTLPIGDQNIKTLETWIDAAVAEVTPLRQFILPGGCELAARFHLARTVARRAERSVVTLASRHDVPPAVLVYLNRLADLLFAWARRANSLAGVAESVWRTPDSS